MFDIRAGHLTLWHEGGGGRDLAKQQCLSCHREGGSLVVVQGLAPKEATPGILLSFVNPFFISLNFERGDTEVKITKPLQNIIVQLRRDRQPDQGQHVRVVSHWWRHFLRRLEGVFRAWHASTTRRRPN